jgi:hypothetical protein
MRRLGLVGCIAVLGIVLLAALAPARQQGQAAAPCRSSLIPAYVPPPQLAELVVPTERPRIVVINPASGPGDARMDGYREAVDQARERGTEVLGYVATGYGSRDAAAVAADVERYRDWYGVTAIFFDESTASDRDLPHYRAVTAAARAAGVERIAMNPGVVPARGYFSLADVIVTFEGPYAEYARAVRDQPAWLRTLRPERIAHLIYGAGREEALRVAEMDSGAGYLYATDGVQPGPWNALPAFLGEQEARLAQCHGTGGS